MPLSPTNNKTEQNVVSLIPWQIFFLHRKASILLAFTSVTPSPSSHMDYVPMLAMEQSSWDHEDDGHMQRMVDQEDGRSLSPWWLPGIWDFSLCDGNTVFSADPLVDSSCHMQPRQLALTQLVVPATEEAGVHTERQLSTAPGEIAFQCTEAYRRAAVFMHLTYHISREEREKALHWLSSTFHVQTRPWPLLHPEKRKAGAKMLRETRNAHP